MDKYLPHLTNGDYAIALGVTLGTLALALATPIRRRRRAPPPTPTTEAEPDVHAMISQYRRRRHGGTDA